MKNFDAMWKEVKKKGQKYKVKGVNYELPTSVPALLVLNMMDREENEEIKGNVMKEMSFGLLGKKNVEEMLDNGLTLEELQDLFEWASSELMPKNEKAPTGKE